jgi:hypothetical protein
MLRAAFILGLVGTLTGCFSVFILLRLARGIDNAARRAEAKQP